MPLLLKVLEYISAYAVVFISDDSVRVTMIVFIAIDYCVSAG
jgi:hypothetical protein